MPSTDKTDTHRPNHRQTALRIGATSAAVVLIALAGTAVALEPRAELKVSDAKTAAPVSNAVVTIGKEQFKTDEAGVAHIRTFTTGTVTASVSREAYDAATASLTLQYGKKHSGEIQLTPAAKTLSLSFTVKDQLTGDALNGATVRLPDGTEQHTDDQGQLNVTVAEDAQLAIHADHYREQQIPATAITSELVLLPEGNIVFVSNRDQGKKGLFVTNYNGSDVKSLVARDGETEDYQPIPSPDRSLVAFTSTRGDQKDQYGNYQTHLYLVRADGTGLKKLSDGTNPNDTEWSSTGRFLYWVEILFGENDTLKRYSTSSGQVVTLASYPAIYSNIILTSDGMRIAYQALIEQPGENSLIVSNADGTNVHSTRSGGIGGFTFNRDDNVEFTRYEAPGKRFVFFTDSGVVQEEQRDEEQDRTYITSPNGASRLFTDTGDGKTDLYLLDSTGKELRVTTVGSVTSAESAYWTADSRFIIFASQSPTESAFYIVAPGHDAHKITDATFDGYGGYF